MLNDLAVLHPVCDMEWYIPGFSRGRHAHEGTLVRAACTANDRYQVIFGDHLFDPQRVAWEGCLIHGNVIFQRPLSNILVHEFWCFGFAADGFDVSPNEFFVFLRVNEIFSFPLLS